ncbi:serine/threonine-protein kinase [Streptomyces sp. NPDC001381]|uniref:serine/threonine-protein kinase n=1 Tax=Streptomyces sp. NPDC001381 TaxID=3364567 RepID=UPI0036C202AB
MKTWSVPGFTEIRELGAGASGRVVMAVETASGTPVAVKYLNERLTGDARFLEEFRAEAELLKEIDSPHVARLRRYVESRDGAAMVLELVEGCALRTLLRREGATTPEAALTVLKGSLLGLSAAHRLGIVHRDYKPENVLVTREASSKLVDFGIAARDGSVPDGASGTPMYMAPEQWRGHPASPATDVYAVTVTFFECVTGVRPFGGRHLTEVAAQHLSAPVPADAVPEPLRALVLRGMAKSPSERIGSADEFLDELETAAAAGYGPDWEERGRRALAALATALLLELAPSPVGGTDAVTDLATTEVDEMPTAEGPHRGRRAQRSGGRTRGPGVVGAVRRRPRRIPAIVAATVVLGGVAVTAIATTQGSAGNTALTTPAQDSRADGGPTAGPSAGDIGDHSPAASPTPANGSLTAGPPGSSDSPAGRAGQKPGTGRTPAGGTSSGTGTGTGTNASAGGATAGGPSPSTAPQQPSASPAAAPAAMAVRSVDITSLKESTQVRGADAAITVTTTGTDPVTLLLTWYNSEQAGVPGQQDGTTETYRLSGRTSYRLSYHHAFTTCPRYWGLRVSTAPGAETGDSYRDMDALACILGPIG